MRTKFILPACLIALLSFTSARAQTMEEIQNARRLRADAAYLEIMGETARAIEQYEASLRMVPDATIAQKVAELRDALGVASPVHTTAEDVAQLAGEIYARLDLNGFLLMQFNVESLIESLREEIDALREVFAGSGIEENAEDEFMAVLKLAEPVIDWLGLYSIRGIGMSVAPVGPRIARAKTYLRIDENQADRALWRLAGNPAPISRLGYFPADTALALASTIGLGDLLDIVGDAEAFFPDINSQMDQMLDDFSAMMPGDVSAVSLIDSLKGGMFVGLILSDTTRVEIPLDAEEILDIPQPALILGFRCENELLYDLVLGLVQEEEELPLIEQVVEGTVIHSVSLPVPLPFPVQPAMAMHEGTLLIASHPDVLVDAISAYAQGGGLLTSPAFLEASGALPETVNSFVYASETLFREYEQHALTLMTQDLPPETVADLKVQVAQYPSRKDDNFLVAHSVRDLDGMLWVTRTRTPYTNPWAPSMVREVAVYLASMARAFDYAEEYRRMYEERMLEQQQSWEELEQLWQEIEPGL